MICHVPADLHPGSSPTESRRDRSSAASNGIAVTALLREVKSGRAKFGQIYCAWGCFHVFCLCS
ncbi:hypothetical protein BF49_2273 [Bradyrhizobium sp.]|nr:hypothetical protein BF49_2273 [Bradyrhizobium sp.]